MEKTYRIRVKLKDFSRRFYHDDYQHSSPIFAKVGGNIERKKYKLKQYSYEGNFLIYDIWLCWLGDKNEELINKVENLFKKQKKDQEIEFIFTESQFELHHGMHGGRGNVPIGYPIFHHLEIKDAISIELVEIENKIAQEWLDKNYPSDESKKKLENGGVLKRLDAIPNWDKFVDFINRDYPNYIYTSEGSLVILENCQEIKKIYDQWRRKITNFVQIHLEGSLDLNGFEYLEEVSFAGQNLTAINLDDCFNLKKLDLSDNNNLTELDLSNNFQLIYLNLKGIKGIKQLDILHLDNLHYLRHDEGIEVFTFLDKYERDLTDENLSNLPENLIEKVNSQLKSLRESSKTLRTKDFYQDIDWCQELVKIKDDQKYLLREVRKHKSANYQLNYLEDDILENNNNLIPDEVNKLLEDLKINEVPNNPFGESSSNQLVRHNQSLIISGQGALADILRKEKKKQEERCAKEYEELKDEIKEFTATFKQEVSEETLNTGGVYERLNIFNHKKNSLSEYLKGSSWKKEFQSLNNHFNKIKEIVESYKKLKKVEREKEESNIKTSEIKSELEEMVRIQSIEDDKERVFQEKSHWENKKDNVFDKLYDAKEELRKFKPIWDEKMKRWEEAKKNLPKFIREKMILEAALGKEYSFNDKDLEEEDSDKEKEPTPQEVLGVDKNATPEEVKKSYRRLSLQYHPDKQIGKSTEEKKQATEMMTKVNEAYEKMTGKNVECEEKLSVAELEKIDKERKESKKKMWEEVAEEYQGSWEMKDIFNDLANDTIVGSIKGDLSIAIINKKRLEKALKSWQEGAIKLREIANIMKPEVSFDEQERVFGKLIGRGFSISGEVEEIIPFDPWFNHNCATVVTEDKNLHYIHLVVYESDEFTLIKAPTYSKAFWGAKEGARELREKMKYSQNPVLEIFPWTSDSYVPFSEIINQPYVKRINIPYELGTEMMMVRFPNDSNCRNAEPKYRMVEVSKRIINKNPEQFLKPLDVVWVEKESFGVSFYHIGVYLGKNNVCHFSSRGKSRESNKSIITDWNFFVEGSTSDAFAYRSIVPFKHYELIAKQIDWANENNYDEGRYCLPNNNCEYHANGFVFGISYSQQVKERKPWFWPKRCDFCESCKSGKVNRGRSSAINLNSEISSTNGGLRNKTGHWYKEIKENYEAKILIEKNNCNIM